MTGWWTRFGKILVASFVVLFSFVGYRYALETIIPPSLWFVNPGGERILKIVLITKNELPLLKSWVLHHGSIFGFDNLHILDSSDDAAVLKVLEDARKLGVDVVTQSANLNELESQINEKMEKIKARCDFMIKLDTDELLALYDPHTMTFQVDRKSIFDYLATLPFDGDMYKVGWIASSVVEQDKCKDDDDVFRTATKFTPFVETLQKTFFNSRSYRHVDLGSHIGWLHPALENRPKWSQYRITRLAIFHFHSQCFHRVVENNLRAILSHGYLDGKESKEIAIKKLGAILGPDYPSKCSVLSCHKVYDYMSYLMDHEIQEKSYYEKYGPTSTQIETKLLKQYIESVEKNYTH